MGGGNFESLTPIPPDSPVEIIFTFNGGEKKKKVRLSGMVVWSGQVPVPKRPNSGRQIYATIDPRHREGDFPEERVKSAIQRHHKEISKKEFLSIREFARKLGVHWFTVWRWTVENRIKFKQVKSGCKILIPSSELSQFQASPE
jgi:excisionase family DNA binding protein